MFIAITLLILLTSITVAYIYSYLILNTNILADYRVQNIRYTTGVFEKHIGLIGFNIAILAALTFVGLYFFEWIFIFETPSIWMFALQVLIIMAIDDTWFYFSHRALHENEMLFAKIHKIHHRACPPFPLEFIYVHPLEWMLGAVGILFGVVVVYIGFGEVNAYAFWAYSFYRNIHEVEIHSGIRSIFAHKIPFFGTTEHHDYHHSLLKGNYASTFKFWDWLLGTELRTK